MSRSRAVPRPDVDATINSGQVFLWERHDGDWFGVDGQRVIRAGPLEPGFFRQDDDILRILGEISRDATVARAIRQSPGLRLLRQDPFQCCVSFIASSNSNIPRIRGSLQRLCRRFGKRARSHGREFFLFPTPGRLAGASTGELRACGLGYRAEFVGRAAACVRDGEIDLEALRSSKYHAARDELVRIPGVGGKVADCILLFSLDKLEAFPLDRWMIRVLGKYYPGRFDAGGPSLTRKRYDKLHERTAGHFGQYAGYAQQFLFKMERDLARKGW